MELCATKYSVGIAAALVVVAACEARAQQLPTLPSGANSAQVQQLLQQPGLGELLRQRIQQSGLTADQIRAQLQAMGYSPNLIDQYLPQGISGGAGLGAAAPMPTSEMLRAVTALGIGGFVPVADSLAFRRDSVLLTRGDSLLLDSLSLRVGFDSIPTRRDSLGFLRIDSLGAIRLADRLHRPRVFGLDVFRRAGTQFTPLASGPVDPDYRLGPGDELVLIVTGQVEQAYQLPVTREGFIVIAQVGQIFVNNLTLDQLRDVLYARLGRVFSGVGRGPGARTQFQLALSKVRANQVFVTGEVARPGAYTVNALGTVMNALYAAGGPTERGDFRSVRVLRSSRLVTTLDLYDYLLSGKTQNDVRLEQGDVIFVPPVSRRVAIRGAVTRPALYDLAEGQDLRELIQMAGGLLPEAYTGRAQIERVLPPDQREPGGRDRIMRDVDLQTALRNEAPAVRLEPDDKVTIFAVTGRPRNTVTIRGGVWRPGVYQLDSGMTLSRLIADAGGLKPDVYADRAQIVRLNPDSTSRLIPVSLLGIPPQGAPGATAPDPVGVLPPMGRLQADPLLQELDEVTVYSKTDFRPTRQIYVMGNVQRPGTFAFTDSMTLRDAIMMAGGLQDNAYLLEAEISRLPRSPQSDQLAQIIRIPLDSSYVLDPTGYQRRAAGVPGADVVLEPYDNLFIRRVPGFEFQRNVVLTGQVRFPGRYTLARRDERLREIIERAGGLTPDAYVQGAQFFRSEGHKGQIGIDLRRVLRDSTYRDNLILLAGDSLYLPLYQPVVSVEGGVNSPVSVAYVPGQGVSYYIDRAGGYTRRADRGRTYVVEPNGAIYTHHVTVEPGARVIVPERPAGETGPSWIQVSSAIAAVLSSALTIILVIQRL